MGRIVRVTVKIELGFASYNYATVTSTIIPKLYWNAGDYLYKLYRVVKKMASKKRGEASKGGRLHARVSCNEMDTTAKCSGGRKEKRYRIEIGYGNRSMKLFLRWQSFMEQRAYPSSYEVVHSALDSLEEKLNRKSNTTKEFLYINVFLPFSTLYDRAAK